MDKRLVLKNVYVAPSQDEATVELVLDDREVAGQARWSGTAKDVLTVVAEATLNAVAKFLRPEIGLILGKIMKAPDVVYVRVDFRTPQGVHPLWGISPLTDDHPGTVAKAILSAINRRSGLVFAEPSAWATAMPAPEVSEPKPAVPEVPVPVSPAAAVASSVGRGSEWEDSVKEQLASRGLTLDAEGNVIPLPVPERPAPVPAAPRRRSLAGAPSPYAQRFSPADLPEEAPVKADANGLGDGVTSRPSLTGIDGEDLWRLVEALIEKYRFDIFRRLGSPQQTNSVEDIKLAQGELKALEWMAGVPGREVKAIRSLIGAPS